MDLYREEILEHWRSPQNWGVMPEADLVIDQINPLCGDKVTFYFKFSRGPANKNLKLMQSMDIKSKISNLKLNSATPRIIKEVRFVGSGCAISIASSSMLSSYIKGKSIRSLEKITGKKVLDLIGGLVAPARLKCVFLPLEIIRKLKDN